MAKKPVKLRDYIVEIDGVDTLEVQKVSGLEATVDVVEHNAGGRKRKTPGTMDFPNITLEKVTNIGTSDNWAWQQLQKSGINDTAEVADDFEFDFSIRTKDSSEIWEVTGFVIKVSLGDVATMDGDNRIQTVEIAVNDLRKIR